jgi:hypothetical protein
MVAFVAFLKDAQVDDVNKLGMKEEISFSKFLFLKI